MESSPSRALAQVLLDRIPEAQTKAAIRDIAASLSLDAKGYATAYLVIQLLEQIPDVRYSTNRQAGSILTPV